MLSFSIRSAPCQQHPLPGLRPTKVGFDQTFAGYGSILEGDDEVTHGRGDQVNVGRHRRWLVGQIFEWYRAVLYRRPCGLKGRFLQYQVNLRHDPLRKPQEPPHDSC